MPGLTSVAVLSSLKCLRKSGLSGSEKVTEYKYPHAFANHFVEQVYLNVPKKYYRPTDQGYEATISKRLDSLKS